MGQTDLDRAKCERLTEKQRDVMQLVVQRKSSKQIARMLGISKPTVDQRIASARHILGAGNRDEAAIMFARCDEMYDRVTYDPSCVSPSLAFSDRRDPEARKTSGLVLEEAAIPFSGILEYQSSNPTSFRRDASGDLSTASRLLVITGLTVGILAAILIGLSVAQSLSDLLAAP